MSNNSPRPDLIPEAAEVVDLAERLIGVLEQETDLIGPGLTRDNRSLIRSKAQLVAQLAARLEILATIELDAETGEFMAELDQRLRAAAGQNEAAVQSVLDSHSRILRQLSDQAGRRARPVTYGPRGALKDQPKPPGAVPGGGKKI
jgi:hypothetical protein